MVICTPSAIHGIVPNYLCFQVFDTELIGEGAIGTYNHANQELLTSDRIVVPGRARMFAQVRGLLPFLPLLKTQPLLAKSEKVGVFLSISI